MDKVFLKPGRDATVRGGNPWIFSGGIERIEPRTIEAGSPVEVHDASGGLIGHRLHQSRDHHRGADAGVGRNVLSITELIEHRLNDALALRKSVVGDHSDCYRLVNGDGDGLSGVVIDRYAEVLVVQLLTAGADRCATTSCASSPSCFIRMRFSNEVPARCARTKASKIARPCWRVRRSRKSRCARTAICGRGDFEHGQKTGYFLDQRENRARLARLCARRQRVLDAYCYAGGFALAALSGGAARAVGVDTSARAIGWAQRNLELNGHESTAELIRADAAEFMRTTKERFDVIALDPPPLARSRKDVERAGRLYVELNALAMNALAAGGRLMTFSCSTHFRGDDFIRAVSIAQTKAKRNLRILAHLGPGPDHPVLLGHGEGEYLTGLLLQDLG